MVQRIDTDQTSRAWQFSITGHHCIHHMLVYLHCLLIHFIYMENPYGCCLLFYYGDNNHNKQNKTTAVIVSWDIAHLQPLFTWF